MLGIELQQTRVYQDAKAEGAVGEARSLILRQLNRKVGDVLTQVEVRIEALPLAKLDELGEALLDFQEMDDLLAWLNNNS
jgi:predicted transposase YdaD